MEKKEKLKKKKKLININKKLWISSIVFGVVGSVVLMSLIPISILIDKKKPLEQENKQINNKTIKQQNSFLIFESLLNQYYDKTFYINNNIFNQSELDRLSSVLILKIKDIVKEENAIEIMEEINIKFKIEKKDHLTDKDPIKKIIIEISNVNNTSYIKGWNIQKKMSTNDKYLIIDNIFKNGFKDVLKIKNPSDLNLSEEGDRAKILGFIQNHNNLFNNYQKNLLKLKIEDKKIVNESFIPTEIVVLIDMGDKIIHEQKVKISRIYTQSEYDGILNSAKMVKSFTINKKQDLDLSNAGVQDEVLQFIKQSITELQSKEKIFLKLMSKTGIITHNEKIDLILQYDYPPLGTKGKENFIIKIDRTKSDDEQLKTIEDRIVNKNLVIENQDNLDLAIPSTQKRILETIWKFNSELLETKKSAFSFITKTGLIIRDKEIKVILKISLGAKTKNVDFYFRVSPKNVVTKIQKFLEENSLKNIRFYYGYDYKINDLITEIEKNIKELIWNNLWINVETELDRFDVIPKNFLDYVKNSDNEQKAQYEIILSKGNQTQKIDDWTATSDSFSQYFKNKKYSLKTSNPYLGDLNRKQIIELIKKDPAIAFAIQDVDIKCISDLEYLTFANQPLVFLIKKERIAVNVRRQYSKKEKTIYVLNEIFKRNYHRNLNNVDVSLFDNNNIWPNDLRSINWENIIGLKMENTPFKGDIFQKGIKINGSKTSQPTILSKVDLSQVTNWPANLINIDWSGAIGLTKNNTPFKGDISKKNITNNVLRGVDVSGVTSWPSDLSGIDWTGVKGLTSDNNPFQEDISDKNISNSIFNGINLNIVKKWPNNLRGINWSESYLGTHQDSWPFKGKMNDKFIEHSILKGINISQVTSWPKDLSGIDWTGVITNPGKNVFNDGLAKTNINGSPFLKTKLNNLDITNINIWPDNLSGIDWTNVQGLTSTNTPFQGDVSKNIINSVLNGIDVSGVKSWPSDLSGMDWTNVQGLTSTNTPFKGDVSKNITNSVLNGIDVSGVTSWPSDLSGIDWTGVKGLTSTNTPFQGDISENIVNSILNGIDISKVTKWPIDLSGINWMGVILKGDIDKIELQKINNGAIYVINFKDTFRINNWPNDLNGIDWTGVKGLTSNNTPFKGDIGGKNIINNVLNGVDVSGVTSWPIDLSGIDWTGVKGLTSNNNPFKNIIDKNIVNNVLNGVDVSGVTSWPSDLSGIDWTNVKGLTLANTFLKGNIKDKNITNVILNGINVSGVTSWPSDLSGIDWTGVKGLINKHSPFQGDISDKNITNSVLNGIDVSGVKSWPSDLSGMDWTNVQGLTSTNTPFKGDISDKNIINSFLNGVDVSGVTSWPSDLSGIDWENVINLQIANTPFKGDMTKKDIRNSILYGVDVSQIKDWLKNNSQALNVNLLGCIGLK